MADNEIKSSFVRFIRNFLSPRHAKRSGMGIQMKAAICEDETFYSDLLARQVTDYFQEMGETAEISVFTDGAPLLSLYQKGGRFDLVFLDLQLEASDGMEVAAQIRSMDRKVPLVFVTGAEWRAVEGYTVSALDYVVKTGLKERLNQTLDRFVQNRNSMRFAVPTADGSRWIVPFAELLWMESEGRGTLLHTVTGNVFSPLPIGKLSKELPEEEFVEIHKAVYVRTEAIRRIGSDTLEMSSGEHLPLSRRRRKAVMSAVMSVVKGQPE